MRSEDGGLLLKLVFYLAMPALVLVSFNRIHFTLEFIYLPLMAGIVLFVSGSIAYFAGKRLELPRQAMGTFIIAAMIMNTGFSLPFVVAAYGDEGLVRLAMFDLGNASLVLTVVYFIAGKYGGNGTNGKAALKKVLTAPPVWALFIATLLNVNGMRLPQTVIKILDPLSATTIPFLLLALGAYFDPQLVRPRAVLVLLPLRMGLGLLLGIGLAKLLGLQGLTFNVAVLCSAAPVGFNALTFTYLEKLDIPFAASLLSLSILIALFWLPGLLFFLD